MHEIKRKRRKTSTLLAQAPDPELISLDRRSRRRTPNKQASHSRQIIALHVPTTVVVIYEPRGLNNPITMGIKTSKAYWVWNG